MSNERGHTIIISGGGTGGHIYPAIAIANEFKSRHPNTNILFVGALGKMEMEKVPEAGYPIIGLPITGIKRSLSLQNLAFPFKLLASYIQAQKIIKKHSPDVVIGVGGYASGPIMLAAQRKNIPTVIQEQNSYAGITNKKLAKKAARICVAYDGMEKVFPKEKLVNTGNPVRSDILDLRNKKQEALEHFGLDDGKTNILAIGGSLGALSINESLKKAVNKFNERKDLQLIWQTGKYFYPQTKGLDTKNVKVNEFIKRMDLAYAAADIIVSRAGALSISELCLVGKPAILIPFPYAAEDHQTHNAMSLVDHEAAMMIEDKKAREILVDQLFDLIKDEDRQKTMSVNISKLGKPDAAKDIVKEIDSVISMN